MNVRPFAHHCYRTRRLRPAKLMISRHKSVGCGRRTLSCGRRSTRCPLWSPQKPRRRESLSRWKRRCVPLLFVLNQSSHAIQMEEQINERVESKKNELSATYDERILNYEERYVHMQHPRKAVSSFMHQREGPAKASLPCQKPTARGALRQRVYPGQAS
jgi:hypothetical protein